MAEKFTAETSIEINASADKVWKALTDPATIKKFMFGADVETDWKKGSKIRYFGEFEGKPFEEKGEILDVQPGKLLATTNYSTMMGKEDKPENYDPVTYKLDEANGKTTISVSQGNIANEKAIEGSKKNWDGVLQGLKKTVEEMG